MTLEALVIWLVVGGVAGWLASQIMKSGGLRITGNPIADTIITGIIGAFVGGWLLGVLGVSIGGGMIGSIISALIGAIVFIFGLGLIKR
ncbi:MAG: GlsB/YeaQ/YmgE family stress response membrane protein [bacterium]|nr:GlsB/YeaQ/YmgE family stress response membrane protein [bacterium]